MQDKFIIYVNGTRRGYAWGVDEADAIAQFKRRGSVLPEEYPSVRITAVSVVYEESR